MSAVSDAGPLPFSKTFEGCEVLEVYDPIFPDRFAKDAQESSSNCSPVLLLVATVGSGFYLLLVTAFVIRA